jgi:hypothetical protein
LQKQDNSCRGVLTPDTNLQLNSKSMMMIPTEDEYGRMTLEGKGQLYVLLAQKHQFDPRLSQHEQNLIEWTNKNTNK